MTTKKKTAVQKTETPEIEVENKIESEENKTTETKVDLTENKKETDTKIDTQQKDSEKTKESKIKVGVIEVSAEEAQLEEFRKFGIRSKGTWKITAKKDGFRVEHLST